MRAPSNKEPLSTTFIALFWLFSLYLPNLSIAVNTTIEEAYNLATGITNISSPPMLALQGTFDPRPELTNGTSDGVVGKKRPLSMLEISEDDYHNMLIKYKRRKEEHYVSKLSNYSLIVVHLLMRNKWTKQSHAIIEVA